MRRHSDGFSLIEVIIAIAVLAIVAMSLLSYFSGANRYANWGKTSQKADMAAQSVVEELASCTTFAQIENDLAASGSAWKVVSTPSVSNDVYELSRELTVDDTDYIARVKLDFDSYKSTAMPEVTTTPLSRFNDYEAPQLEKIYSENNVVLEETDQTEAAVGDIFARIYQKDKGITKSTVRNGLQRTLHIDIAPYAAGTGEQELYLVKGRYEYRYDEAGEIMSCEMPLKTVKIEKDSLQKIYFFYRPVNDTLATEVLDITADSSLPAGFELTDFSYYIVLQQDTVIPPIGYRLDITSGGNPASVELKNKVYNNANPLLGGSDGLITHKAKDRIATVTVDIYYADETEFKEENRIVTVQTSKGA